MWRHIPLARRGRLLGVVLAAVWLGIVSADYAPGAVRAQQSPHPLLQELAERLLTPWPSMGPTGWSERPRARLFPGALPPDLGVSLPLPPGSRLVGSTIPSPQPGVTTRRVEVVADAPASPADVLAFYEVAMPAAGWDLSPRFRPGATQPEATSGRAVFCPGDIGLSVQVMAFRVEGRSDVRVVLDEHVHPDCKQEAATNPYPPLSAEEVEQVRRLVFGDQRVRQVLELRGYRIEQQIVWYTGGTRRGAVLILGLDQPLTLRATWPGYVYDKTLSIDPPYEEIETTYTARAFDRLSITLDLLRERVIGISPSIHYD